MAWESAIEETAVEVEEDLLEGLNSSSELDGSSERETSDGHGSEGGDGEKKGMSKVMKKNLILFAAIMATIVAGSANNILFYKISIPFANYPFFLVLYSSVFSVPTFWCIVAVILLVPRWKHYVTRDMMAFALWKFAVLGLLDSIQVPPHTHTHTHTVSLTLTLSISLSHSPPPSLSHTLSQCFSHAFLSLPQTRAHILSDSPTHHSLSHFLAGSLPLYSPAHSWQTLFVFLASG